jgi:sec-independent protein translocase protein TatA
MGIAGINIWQLLVLILIVILLFGTNKLRNIGADLGGAIKGFRNAMRENEGPTTAKKPAKEMGDENNVIEGGEDSAKKA